VADKKALSKRVLEFAAGMATELLYTVFLAAVAFLISVFAAGWF